MSTTIPADIGTIKKDVFVPESDDEVSLGEISDTVIPETDSDKSISGSDYPYSEDLFESNVEKRKRVLPPIRSLLSEDEECCSDRSPSTN